MASTTLVCVFFRLFVSPPPSLIPSSFPSRSHLRYCSPLRSRSRPRSRPRSYLLFVHGSPPPSPLPFQPRPRSRPYSCLRSFVPLYPRSRSCTVPITVHVPVPVSIPAPDSDPAPDPVRSFPSLGHAYPLGAILMCRHRALREELSGARKWHPLLLCYSLHHLGRQPLSNPFLKYNEPRPS